MKIGFGKRDITPRIGVELSGYSGYLNRYATAVRDPLYARAMAVADGITTAVIVSCDIVQFSEPIVAEIRRRFSVATGLAGECLMIHATHTHSGPCMELWYRNAYDPPYMEILRQRVTAACVDAVENLKPATLGHATVPCEGIGCNRAFDTFNHKEAALTEEFRPAMPERTDTECQVFTVHSDGRMTGFISSFACHPVIGGSASTYIHGDYCGIATGMLEREFPGTTGLFLQGASGDINPAACCFGNDIVLRALDFTAGRYARAVRAGIQSARELADGPVVVANLPVVFSHREVPRAELVGKLAEEQAVIDAADACDSDRKFRMAIMRSLALRSLLERVDAGTVWQTETTVQGIRIGPLSILSAPLEIFFSIGREVIDAGLNTITLVLGVTNASGENGYAPDREAAQIQGDYAATTVPLWKHNMPYANIHDELAAALKQLDREIYNPTGPAGQAGSSSPAH